MLRMLRSTSKTTSQLISALLLASAVSLLAASFSPWAWGYIILVSLALFLPIAGISLNTEIYSQYSTDQRGKRFLTSMIAGNLGVLGISSVGRWLYDWTLSTQTLLIFLSAQLLVASFFARRIPSKPQKRDFQHFSQLWQTLIDDRLFAYMCSSWFILGAANLWLLPYRTNYLIEKGLGPELSARDAILLIVIVPECIRMCVAPIYARLFDRLNFIFLRMVINAFFALYCITFFTAQSFSTALLGSTFMGLAMGGGTFAWQLWVTKIAPANKAPTYMIIHTTLTGVRKVFCPLVGLWALNHWGGSTCSAISFSMICFATLMLVPVLSLGKQRFNH